MSIDTPQNGGHETVLDVSGEQVASVYARAFLRAAGAADSAPSALADFEAVVGEVVEQHPRFSQALCSAFLSHEERVGMIDRVFGGRVAPVVVNTLKVMSAHGRLELLRSVCQQAHEMHDREQGRVGVTVTSAAPLDAATLDKLRTTLGAKLGIEPVFKSLVEPEMIAGLKIRVGDTVYDGSVRTVFDKARAAMIERAVARIEQSPDSFLSATPPPADQIPENN